MKVTQSCPTLCEPMDYTVHGILQARRLEWVAFTFSTGPSQPQGSDTGLVHCGRILFQLSHKGSPGLLEKRKKYLIQRVTANEHRISSGMMKMF